MATIDNDQDLRRLLTRLSADQQRIIGARFARSVVHLSRNDRVNRAVDTALRADASPEELADAYHAAKAWSTKTYTECGKDTDWLGQADHFVAAAAAAALTPRARTADNTNPAWKAAMHARMASTCELVECVEETDAGVNPTNEILRQYVIAEDFIDAVD